jgi:hypothetical protein
MANEILTARVTLPEHVVRREFPEETIVLNLRTGLYHGLNATAAAMLEALEDGAPVGETAERLARHFGQPSERVSADLVTLVGTLRERDLVEIHAGGD